MKLIIKRHVVLWTVALIMFSGALFYSYSIISYKPKDIAKTPVNDYIGQERGSTDSIYQFYIKSIDDERKVVKSKNEAQVKEDINVEKILYAGFLFIGGIVTVMKLWDKNDFKKIFDWMDNHDKLHMEQSPLLNSLGDNRNRDDIITELNHIRESAIMFCHNVKLRVLIENISKRTIDFTRDNMNETYNQELYDYAMATIEAKMFEGQLQLKQMKLGEEFKKEFLIIQAECCDQLRVELKKIVDDRLVNHKYRRFGDTAKNYLKNYLSLVVDAFNTHELNSNG